MKKKKSKRLIIQFHKWVDEETAKEVAAKAGINMIGDYLNNRSLFEMKDNRSLSKKIAIIREFPEVKYVEEIIPHLPC